MRQFAAVLQADNAVRFQLRDADDFPIGELATGGTHCVRFELKFVAPTKHERPRLVNAEPIEIAAADGPQLARHLDHDSDSGNGDDRAGLRGFTTIEHGDGTRRVESRVGFLCNGEVHQLQRRDRVLRPDECAVAAQSRPDRLIDLPHFCAGLRDHERRFARGDMVQVGFDQLCVLLPGGAFGNRPDVIQSLK